MLGHITLIISFSSPPLQFLTIVILLMRSNDHLPSVGLDLFCAALLEDHGVCYCPDLG